MLALETQPLVQTKPNGASIKNKTSVRQSSKRLKVVILLLIALFIVIVAVVATNTKSETEWVQIETVGKIPTSWKWHTAVNPNERITLTLALKQQNIEELEEELLAVSDPKSSKYGQHWTYQQIHDLLEPSARSKSTIHRWLSHHGIHQTDISQITPNGDFIEFETTIAHANKLLRTEFGYWKHSETGKSHIRVREHYSVPKHVSKHLDFISPTLRFPVTPHTRLIEEIDDFDKSYLNPQTATMTYVFPSSLKTLYGVNDVKGGKSDSNYQAVASFIDEWYNDDDLTQFWNFFDIETTTVNRIPAVQPEGYGSEAELDVQYITAMGEKVQTLVWDIEDDLFFVTLLKQIGTATYPTPSVVSMSYGGDEPSVGFGYSMRANIEFGKIGLLGVTFFASSGDAGVLSSDETCTNNEEFVATFPASSPYVTAVGGTTGGLSSSDDSSDDTEGAWSYSGGGFSSFFDQKSFQKDAIAKYLSNNGANSKQLPESYRYTATGAAYPDLAAQSEYFVICDSGSYWAMSGTSASCPTVAGMIALINDARLAKGKSTLGYLNPAIYGLYNEGEQSTYFNDIVDGYNIGCANDNTGFYTDDGWDPVTGLGTLKFDKLYDYLVDL